MFLVFLGCFIKNRPLAHDGVGSGSQTDVADLFRCNIPARIISRLSAPIGNEESRVDPHDNVEDDDQQFHREIEYVEARLRVIPCRIVPGSRIHVIDPHAEGGPKSEERCGQQQYEDFGTKAPAAKLFHPGVAWYHQAAEDEWNGKKSNDGIESLTI